LYYSIERELKEIMSEALAERGSKQQSWLVYKVEELRSLIQEHKKKLVVIGYNSSG